MYNKVILMGRITHDLELKTTQSNLSVCSFSIAVDRRFGKGEERQTDFFNIVAWRQQAEFVCRYFAKGRMILVEGELQTRTYTDKNGQNVRVTEIIADRLSFTGEAKQQGAYNDTYGGAPAAAPSPAPRQAAPAPAPTTSAANTFAPTPGDDDYPF